MRIAVLIAAPMFIAAMSLGGAAHAANYDIQPLDDKGTFLGCMAVNTEDGVVLLGVENGFSILVTAPEFKVSKGDTVEGTWSIDDSKSRPIADKANGTGTVSIDLEMNKASFDMVTSGDALTVKVGKASHEFSLAGSSKGMAGLSACMSKAGK